MSAATALAAAWCHCDAVGSETAIRRACSAVHACALGERAIVAVATSAAVAPGSPDSVSSAPGPVVPTRPLGSGGCGCVEFFLRLSVAFASV